MNLWLLCLYFTFFQYTNCQLKTVFNKLPGHLAGLISGFFSSNEGSEDKEFSSDLNVYETKLDITTLKFVSVYTRHGSRSPIGTYPTDPYPYMNLKYWPDGSQQLTRFGKRQLFQTGQTLRMRYNGFLDTNYFPNDTSIEANYEDRDFMSAASLLAGLYPPVGYQVWNPFLLWQPIPIWTDPFDVSKLLQNPKFCPTYFSEYQKSYKLINDRISKKYTRLYKYLTINTGRDVKSMNDIFLLYDTLTMDKENGYELPDWAKEVYPEKLEPIYKTAIYTMVVGSDEMVRLASGPVLKNITNQFNKKAQGTLNPNRRFFIDACHDMTLIALLVGLGITEPIVIDTSAYMIFELHENSFGHTVQVMYYNNSATVIPTVLDIPSCSSPCSLNDFNTLVNKIKPKNWNKECHSSATYSIDP